MWEYASKTSYALLVIIHDLHGSRPRCDPDEADAILFVDSDAVLSLMVAAEHFEAIFPAERPAHSAGRLNPIGRVCAEPRAIEQADRL